MKLKKEKIIEFDIEDFSKPTYSKFTVPFSQIISKILPELRKDWKEYNKIGWYEMKNEKAISYETFPDYLKEKYGNKSKQIRKKK